MRRFSLFLICLLFLSACGKDSGEGSSPAGTSDPGGSRNVTECERAWQSMIDSYKVGMVRKYQTTTTSDITPGPAAPHTTTHKETVTSVTPESIVYDVEYVPGGTSTVTLNRTEFLDSLQDRGVARTPASGTEILEKRVEDVSVPAGTFTCDYVKTRVAATEGIETISETWISKDGKSLLVKSTSQSTTPTGKTTGTTELVELTMP